MITASRIKEKLRSTLTPSKLEVIDESYQHADHIGANNTGLGTHFRVRIAAPSFLGLSRVKQHRLVYDAVQEFIDEGLHALAIETLV